MVDLVFGREYACGYIYGKGTYGGERKIIYIYICISCIIYIYIIYIYIIYIYIIYLRAKVEAAAAVTREDIHLAPRPLVGVERLVARGARRRRRRA